MAVSAAFRSVDPFLYICLLHFGDMNLFKYSSFPIYEKCVRVVPNQSTVIAVAPTNIRSFSYGGAPYGSFKLKDCLSYVEKTESNIDDATFTCANLLKNPDMLNSSGHLLSGTSSGHVLLQDLQTMESKPYMIFDVSRSVVRIETNEQVIAVRTADGAVRLLDAQLRSKKIIGSMQAHTDGLTDINLQGRSMHNLLT